MYTKGTSPAPKVDRLVLQSYEKAPSEKIITYLNSCNWNLSLSLKEFKKIFGTPFCEFGGCVPMTLWPSLLQELYKKNTQYNRHLQKTQLSNSAHVQSEYIYAMKFFEKYHCGAEIVGLFSDMIKNSLNAQASPSPLKLREGLPKFANESESGIQDEGIRINLFGTEPDDYDFFELSNQSSPVLTTSPETVKTNSSFESLDSHSSSSSSRLRDPASLHELIRNFPSADDTLHNRAVSDSIPKIFSNASEGKKNMFRVDASSKAPPPSKQLNLYLKSLETNEERERFLKEFNWEMITVESLEAFRRIFRGFDGLSQYFPNEKFVLLLADLCRNNVSYYEKNKQSDPDMDPDSHIIWIVEKYFGPKSNKWREIINLYIASLVATMKSMSNTPDDGEFDGFSVRLMSEIHWSLITYDVDQIRSNFNRLFGNDLQIYTNSISDEVLINCVYKLEKKGPNELNNFLYNDECITQGRANEISALKYSMDHPEEADGSPLSPEMTQAVDEFWNSSHKNEDTIVTLEFPVSHAPLKPRIPASSLCNILNEVDTKPSFESSDEDSNGILKTTNGDSNATSQNETIETSPASVIEVGGDELGLAAGSVVVNEWSTGSAHSSLNKIKHKQALSASFNGLNESADGKIRREVVEAKHEVVEAKHEVGNDVDSKFVESKGMTALDSTDKNDADEKTPLVFDGNIAILELNVQLRSFEVARCIELLRTVDFDQFESSEHFENMLEGLGEKALECTQVLLDNATFIPYLNRLDASKAEGATPPSSILLDKYIEQEARQKIRGSRETRVQLVPVPAVTTPVTEEKHISTDDLKAILKGGDAKYDNKEHAGYKTTSWLFNFLGKYFTYFAEAQRSKEIIGLLLLLNNAIQENTVQITLTQVKKVLSTNKPFSLFGGKSRREKLFDGEVTSNNTSTDNVIVELAEALNPMSNSV